MLKTFPFTGLLVALAACGGSAKAPIVAAPDGGSVGDAGETRLTADGKIQVTVNGTTFELDRAGFTDRGTFVGGLASDRAVGYVSETEHSVAGTALVATPDGFEIGSNFGRLTETTVPTSGTASATGDYVGFVLGDDIVLLMTGASTFDVDFTARTISGAITDREIRLEEGDPTPRAGFSASDLILVETTLTDAGTFAGTIGAATITGNGETVPLETGTFEGLLAGPDVGEVVGGLEVIYSGGGNSAKEAGAFAAY